MPKGKKNLNVRLLVLMFVFLLLLLVLVKVLFKDGLLSSMKSANGKVLVDCTSTIKDKPKKVSGWNTNLYAAKLADTIPDPVQIKDKQDKYSLSKMISKTETGNIYYHVELNSKKELPTDMKRIIEICDENNKAVQFSTTKDTKVSGATKGVQASVTMMIPAFMQDNPHLYRIDGYLFANGKWNLTNRIEGVNVVE